MPLLQRVIFTLLLVSPSVPIVKAQYRGGAIPGASEERPDLSVNAELEGLQTTTGLTIGIFNYEGVGVLRFDKKAFIFRKLAFQGNNTFGAITRDGAKIAIAQTVSKPSLISIVNSDGSGLREYSGIIEGAMMCWSNDDSKLLAVIPSGIAMLELTSGTIRKIPVEGVVTSQCWAPDNTKFVYQTPDSKIVLYDLVRSVSTILTSGSEPSWSPDGSWISYREGSNYYLVQPSGLNRKKLFHKNRAVSGLYWSSDSRFVAYIHQDFFALDTEFYHLMIRRLADGSESTVGGAPNAQNIQWIANSNLFRAIASESVDKPQFH